MALTTWYAAGSVSVAGGSTTVAGTGTLWGSDAIMPGDLFCDPAQPLVPPQRVKEVTSDTTLELWAAWPGAAMADAAYEIRYAGIIERSTAQTRRVLEQLGEVDAYFDVQVDGLADRASYDDRPAGYRVLVSNTGDGRSAIYSKNSAASADWSDPAYITGPAVSLDVGSVTKVPFGAAPNVTLTAVEGGYEFDFDLPGSPAFTIGAVTTGDPQVATVPVAGGYELSFVLPGFVVEGDYSDATAYAKGDVVQHLGSSWVALQATTGNEPPALPTTGDAYWQLLARAGNDGAGTVTTVSGGGGIAVDLADPTDPAISLSPNATTFLDVLVGDAGAGGTKGLVPAPAAGDAAAGKFLKANGTWQIVPVPEGYDPNIALLALEVADLKGGRLGMSGGIADPFDDESGVDVGASENASYNGDASLYSPATDSATTTLNNYFTSTIDSNQTIVDRSAALPAGATVTHVGLYAAGAATRTVKIVREDSATQYDILVSESFAHPGGGFADHQLSEPFVVPPTGTYRLAGYAGNNVGRTDSVPRAYMNGDVGVANDIAATSDTSAAVPLRYTSFTSIQNLTLVSDAFTAAAAPETARLALQVVENEAVTINTDLTGEVSRDGGTTWTAATLALASTNGGTLLYEDPAIDVSGQPSGTAMKWRAKTLNNKNIDLSGVVLQWQ